MRSALRHRVRIIGVVCLVVALTASVVGEVHAAEEHEKGRWEIGIIGGFYKPSLQTLNRVLTDPSLAILQDPNQQLQPNADLPPEVRNLYVPPFDQRFGFSLGMEGKYRYLPRHAFHVTLNLWHSKTQVADTIPFIVGANVNEPISVPRESMYDVQISQIWFGWRYSLWQRSEREGLYLDIGLIGLAFAKLTIDTLVKVNNPNDTPAVVATPFAVASSLEANGFGLTTRWGLGGEYLLNSWLGISARADYIVGSVPRLRVVRFYRPGFSVPPPPEAVISLPPPPNEGDTVTYATVERVGGNPNTESATGTAPLPLELNGLEIMFGIHFYF